MTIKRGSIGPDILVMFTTGTSLVSIVILGEHQLQLDTPQKLNHKNPFSLTFHKICPLKISAYKVSTHILPHVFMIILEYIN